MALDARSLQPAYDVAVRRLLLDLAPLRESVPFRRMWLGTSLSGVGTQLTGFAVLLQVYEVGGSTGDAALVGVFAVVPLVVFGLYGGAIVDAFDRRTVVVTTQVGIAAVAAVLTAASWAGVVELWLLYALVAAQNALFAVNAPARSAIVPRLVGPRLLPAANALGSLSFGVALVLGPLAAGALVGTVGYTWAYGIELVLLLGAIASLVALPAMPPLAVDGQTGRPRVGLGSVVEGLRYLGTRPNVRMTFLVDLCAMVLAMPRVLFPAIGLVLVGGGEVTAGLLVAGIAVGTILGGLFSGPLGRVRHQGRVVVGCVVAWGLAIALFGVLVGLSPGPTPAGGASWVLWPAVAVLAIAGAADTVSSVFRSTILQAATPDAMRGRLQGVFIVVVAGGPQLGTLLLGRTAVVTGEAAAATAGGLACVAAVLALTASQRGFLAYDARRPAP